MVISREERRRGREPRARTDFGPNAEAALDVLELTDLAWHDCYGEVAPPDRVIDDIFRVAKGDLRTLVRASHQAVIDFRDLRMWADSIEE